MTIEERLEILEKAVASILMYIPAEPLKNSLLNSVRTKVEDKDNVDLGGC